MPEVNFQKMLGLAVVPDAPDEAVVIAQNGIAWRVSLTGEFDPFLFADFRSRLIKDPELEEGLLGIAFSPNFAQDRRAYFYYTAGNPRRSVLSRFLVGDFGVDMNTEQVLLEVPQPYPNHNGGQLAFGPDGYLYVGLGDGGDAGDPEGNAQNLGTILGAILRLDVSGDTYRVPPDNPFVGRPGARPEIYAYGLRNPWRFSFDRATGELWAADVGQDRWEEVDRIVSGGNYGWNILEGFECFQASACDTTGLIPPRAVYGHDLGCSITGGYVYRGPSMPELDGWYVYADFCSGRIWAVNTADDSPPVLLAETEKSISSFAELPNGELLVLTYDRAIYQLERAD